MAYTLIMDAVSTCITTSRDTILTTRMSTYAAAPPPQDRVNKKNPSFAVSKTPLSPMGLYDEPLSPLSHIYPTHQTPTYFIPVVPYRKLRLLRRVITVRDCQFRWSAPILYIHIRLHLCIYQVPRPSYLHTCDDVEHQLIK